MTQEQWRRIKTVSMAVLERPEDEHAACIARLCDGDAVLERDVVALLASASKAADLFETPAIDTPIAARALEAIVRSPRLVAGTRVGAYRIVREIGRGGMGTVYLAERADDEYKQRVALKVADARAETVLKWFRDERQTLATLEHPNIARLMDGGTTPDGMPYLVMEYVDGLPIDDDCASRQLTVRERLRLFQQVCAAVDIAHRHLVVHRDLKPGNILVADGVPKLLDFGIATLVDSRNHEGLSATPGDMAPPLLTPLYASPEQINGGSITTATDVYALGVLLHHLLTGQSPYQIRGDAPGELARAIRAQEPLRPSACVTDRAWQRQIVGDLDAIVLKALRKDPAERYASASAFAADVDRYLSGHPVAARGDGVRYRAGKFVRRNAVAVTASALVLIALVAGLGAALGEERQAERERQRAQHHFDSVRQLASSLIFEIHDRIADLPGSVPARQLLITRAVEYFDGLAAEEHENLPLQRELATAYDRLGSVQGRPFRSNLGDSAAALASYRKSLAIRQRIAQAHPDDRQAQLELWSSYHVLGDMLREATGTREALETGTKAYELSQGFQRQWPDDPAVLKTAGQTEVMRQRTFLQSGAIEDMRRSVEAALEINERLLAKQPDSHEVREEIASLHGRMAIALLKLGDARGALPHAQQRVATAAAEMSGDGGDWIQARRRLSSGLLQLAQVQARIGDPAGAEDAQRQALELRQAIVAKDPSDRQSLIDVMVAHLDIGDLLLRKHEFPAAVGPLREAVAIGEKLTAADPDHVFIRLSLVSALVRLSSALLPAAPAEADETGRLIERAASLAAAGSAADPADVRFQFELAQAYAVKGDLASARRESAASADSAKSWYAQSLSILTELRNSGRLAGGTLNGDEPARLAEIENKMHARDLQVMASRPQS